MKSEDEYSDSEGESDYSAQDHHDDSYEEEFASKRKKKTVTPKAKRPKGTSQKLMHMFEGGLKCTLI